jgi:hypothetical protein
LQAHLKAAQANAKPKLLKELAKPMCDPVKLGSSSLLVNTLILLGSYSISITPISMMFPVNISPGS